MPLWCILVANGHLGLLRSAPDAYNNCSGDPLFQAFIPISNWDAVRANGVIFVTLIWTPGSVTLHVSDGGTNRGTASHSGIAVPDVPLRIRLNADFGETYTIENVRVGDLLLRLRLNQTAFRSGETLRVELKAQNLWQTFTGDFYFGALLPDGVTLCFLTRLSPPACAIRRPDSDPRTFEPLIIKVMVQQGFDATFDDLFAFTFHGGDPFGMYTFFAAFTPPDAFNDGGIDPGDIMVIDTRLLSFSQ